MTLNALATEILDINRGNGWNVPVPSDWLTPDEAEVMGEDQYLSHRYKIPATLALIDSEVAEALEEFRKDHRLQQFGEELVDVLIRTASSQRRESK